MRDSGRGRIKTLERRVAQLEQVEEVLVGQNLSLATHLNRLQRDTTTLAEAVLRLAEEDA